MATILKPLGPRTKSSRPSLNLALPNSSTSSLSSSSSTSSSNGTHTDDPSTSGITPRPAHNPNWHPAASQSSNRNKQNLALNLALPPNSNPNASLISPSYTPRFDTPVPVLNTPLPRPKVKKNPHPLAPPSRFGSGAGGGGVGGVAGAGGAVGATAGLPKLITSPDLHGDAPLFQHPVGPNPNAPEEEQTIRADITISPKQGTGGLGGGIGGVGVNGGGSGGGVGGGYGSNEDGAGGVGYLREGSPMDWSPEKGSVNGIGSMSAAAKQIKEQITKMYRGATSGRGGGVFGSTSYSSRSGSGASRSSSTKRHPSAPNTNGDTDAAAALEDPSSSSSSAMLPSSPSSGSASSDSALSSSSSRPSTTATSASETGDFCTSSPSGASTDATNSAPPSPTESLSSPLKPKEFTDADLIELDRLGEGAGGAVHKVQDKRTGLIYARKTITTREVSTRQVIRELAVIATTRHVNIVACEGAYMSPSSSEVKIVMEFCEGGSLEAIGNRIKERGAIVGEKIAGRIAEGVLQGLAYLHSKKTIHRDIKPSNILISRDGIVKLCDFGVSGELIDSMVGTFTGTLYYMAPERMVTGSKGYTVRSDVWSTGITILELVQNRFPFPSDLPPFDLIMHITTGDPPKLEDEGDITWSVEMKDFISQTLIRDATLRPTPREMLQHEWIQSVMKQKVDMARWIRKVWQWPRRRDTGKESSPAGAGDSPTDA